MKRLTLVIGAGGTGSYFIPNLLRQLNTSFIDNKVIVLDGDYLEERNLLRQGFFKDVINNSKSEAMYKMHGRNFFGLFECKTQFLNYADDLLNIIADQEIDYNEILLVSCVDNNMARLRLVLGQQLIKNAYPDKRVIFADSGNEEWFGQTIISVLDFDDKPFLKFKNNKFKVVKSNVDNAKFDTLFGHISDWQTKLTKGDHEISCDIVAEASPQNIATNMMASNVLLFVINRFLNNEVIENIYFDCSQNITQKKNRSNNETLLEFLNSLVEYLNTEEITNVFSERFIEFNKNSKTIYVKPTIKINATTNLIESISFESMKFLLNRHNSTETTSLLDIDLESNETSVKNKPKQESEFDDLFNAPIGDSIAKKEKTAKKETKKIDDSFFDFDIDFGFDTPVTKTKPQKIELDLSDELASIFDSF